MHHVYDIYGTKSLVSDQNSFVNDIENTVKHAFMLGQQFLWH